MTHLVIIIKDNRVRVKCWLSVQNYLFGSDYQLYYHVRIASFFGRLGYPGGYRLYRDNFLFKKGWAFRLKIITNTKGSRNSKKN